MAGLDFRHCYKIQKIRVSFQFSRLTKLFRVRWLVGRDCWVLSLLRKWHAIGCARPLLKNRLFLECPKCRRKLSCSWSSRLKFIFEGIWNNYVGEWLSELFKKSSEDSRILGESNRIVNRDFLQKFDASKWKKHDFRVTSTKLSFKVTGCYITLCFTCRVSSPKK